MSKVLVFNNQGERRYQIRVLMIWLGIVCREVSAAEQRNTIGALAGRNGAPAASAAQNALFEDEMLVMDGLSSDQFHGLLDGLRRNNIPVALKAVVKEQNLTWTAAELYGALLEERKRLSQNRK